MWRGLDEIYQNKILKGTAVVYYRNSVVVYYDVEVNRWVTRVELTGEVCIEYDTSATLACQLL